MWEAIRSNRRRSQIFLGLMGLILIGPGLLIGALVIFEGGGAFEERLATSFVISIVAVGLWLLLMLVALYGGDRLILSTAGAKPIQKEDMPQLWNVVEEMTIASGLPKMPKIYLIDDPSPNAFAVGRKPENASVAVTTGLVRRLNRDELQGVIAHEIGHVKNLDIRFMTIASVTLGTIVLLSDILLRSQLYGGGSRRRSSSKGGGQGQLVLIVIILLFAILAPILARLLYFACSRKREYLADASSARFTRYPMGLASALQKISLQSGSDPKKVNRALAPMYIVNPLQAHSGAVGLFSTHPPTEKRIQILRSMSGEAGFEAYEEAYRKLEGKGSHLIGRETLKSDQSAKVRAPSIEESSVEKADTLSRTREALGHLDRLSGLLMIPCACGMRIKIPEKFNRNSLKCPRCGREHEVPKATDLAVLAGVTATLPSITPPSPPKTMTQYKRKGKGWESFQCSCGKPVHLGPSLSAKFVKCPECGRKIEIL